MHTLLVLDDTEQNLAVLSGILHSAYHVRSASSGEMALNAALDEPRPDLILINLTQSEMQGYEVFQRLQENVQTHDIPVIFITSPSGPQNEVVGLEHSDVDYISSPFNATMVLARVRTRLALKHARDCLAQQNDWLEREVARSMGEDLLIQDINVRALACLAEARDNDIGLHLMRTQAYVDLLARQLKDHPRFRQALHGHHLDLIVKAVPLHDIGKIGVPDAILQKPGCLTPHEFEIMKMHPGMGAAAIKRVTEQVRSNLDPRIANQASKAFDFFHHASEISLGHHEKWDGSGYPDGLVGDATPVSARLMALADAFDALISHRIYKPAMRFEQTCQIIQEGRASHFDPDIVDAFMAVQDRFAAMSVRYR